jgi:hypothetical protein
MKLAAIVSASLLVSACLAEEDVDLDVTTSELTSSSLVLTGGSCVPYASLAPIAQSDTSNANRVLGMTPSQRRAAGVIANPKLSSRELSDYAAIQTNPCHVEGEWSCVSGTGEGGHHWAMCTDGITTCGVGTTGPGTAPTAWCR